MKNICVLGMGYIGLPTACMFANSGLEVHGVDINEEVIAKLRSGKIHLEEPGLQELLEEAIKGKKLSFHLKPVKSDNFIICVPTPINSEQKANLDYVKAASESIIPCLNDGCLVVLESTVPPKTCIDVVKPILEKSGKKVGRDIFLAFCPERVIPNKILFEIVENDRIVGGIDEKSIKMAKNLYKSFVKGDIFETDATTAEIVKLMENTYRDVNIALANEFALVAEDLDISIWEAIALANKHPRVNIHFPGPGVGGHCIPVVPWFIVEKAEGKTHLIKVARGINDKMPEKVLECIKENVELSEKTTITIWGVAFKANTDDSSLSPAKDLIRLLKGENVNVKVHDPFVKSFPYPVVDLGESVQDSDCIVLITNHNYYNTIDIGEISKKMREKTIIDTRNSISRGDWVSKGFKVFIFGDYRVKK